MKLFRKRILKLGNKGLSMVELLCAISILGLVSTAVTSVMVVSADSYQRGSSETEVQQEAQLVANQISDLLIDSTAQVTYAGDTLTIEQDTAKYQVRYDSGEKKLYYSQVIGGTSSGEQLMAENITAFHPDVSNFADTGNVLLNMEFEENTQKYPAIFTVTARNKDTASSAVAVAQLSIPAEVILEPKQQYNIAYSVSGVSGATAEASIVGATSTSTTLASSPTNFKVSVGADEMANMFRLKVDVKSGGAVVLTKYTNIYVRRVNAISVSLQSLTGADKMANAEYKLSALLEGTNFAQAPGAAYDNDYVNPESVRWEILSYTGGTAVPSIIQDASNPKEAVLRLNEDMGNNASIVVKITALHPAGDNKVHSPYDSTVFTTWVINNFQTYRFDDEGLARGSDTAQGEFTAYDTLKSTYGGVRSIYEHRFRAINADGSYGPWTEWAENPEDKGSSINIRPRVSLQMDYDKAYEIQIRIAILDAANVKVWPEPTTPEEAYLIDAEMRRAGASFDSANLGFTDAESGTGIMPLPKNVKVQVLKLNRIVAVKDDIFMNSLNYIIEKKNSATGAWEAADLNEYPQVNSPECWASFKESGDYRVKVWAKQVPVYAVRADGTYYEDHRIDYNIYDEATGTGIFYFTVE